MTALKYAGAKNQIADWILSYFPAGYKNLHKIFSDYKKSYDTEGR